MPTNTFLFSLCFPHRHHITTSEIAIQINICSTTFTSHMNNTINCFNLFMYVVSLPFAATVDVVRKKHRISHMDPFQIGKVFRFSPKKAWKRFMSMFPYENDILCCKVPKIFISPLCSLLSSFHSSTLFAIIASAPVFLFSSSSLVHIFSSRVQTAVKQQQKSLFTKAWQKIFHAYHFNEFIILLLMESEWEGEKEKNSVISSRKALCSFFVNEDIFDLQILIEDIFLVNIF